MKTIGLKDLEVIEKEVETKREPLFLGMEKKDIHRIEYKYNCIYGYDKDGLEVYYEDSNKYWRKTEDGKTIECRDGKYTIDGEEANLI